MKHLGVFASVAGVGVLLTAAAFLPRFDPAGGGGGGVGFALADCDQDGKGERLLARPVAGTKAAPGGVLVVLMSSRGHEHPILQVSGSGKWRFSGNSGAVALADGTGTVRLRARVVSHAEEGMAPDLFVTGRTRAKRFHWIEKGYLKLDAHEIIPGVSAGVVLVGDAKETLDAGLTPAGGGTYVLALIDPLRFAVRFDARGRAARIEVDNTRMRTAQGVGPGSAFRELSERVPGERHGERFVASRYGLEATLGPEDERISALTIFRPKAEGGTAP